VRSAQPIYRYWFEIQGSAVIRNSMIRDLWGDADDASRDHTDGGLEIASSDVTIEGSRIYATGTNGILVINADPRILNTTVANAGDDGIDLQNADPYLYNVTVTDARWAMILMHGSDATIESSRIVDNDHGIFSEDSRPTIRNSTFERNGPYAIRFAGSGRPVLSGNTFVREEDDIEDDTFPVLQVCTGVVALLGAGCLVFLYSIHRAQKVDDLFIPPVGIDGTLVGGAAPTAGAVVGGDDGVPVGGKQLPVEAELVLVLSVGPAVDPQQRRHLLA